MAGESTILKPSGCARPSDAAQESTIDDYEKI
jgi:hypothetical protein